MDRGAAMKGGKNSQFTVVNYDDADDDDDFIDILNGFEAASNAGGSGIGSGGKVLYTPDDIFLDGSGAPTDRFLEALKMERDIITSHSHVANNGERDDDAENNDTGDTCSDDDDSGVRKNDLGYFNTTSSVDNSDCDLSLDAGGANDKLSDRHSRSKDKFHKQPGGVGAYNRSKSNNNNESNSGKSRSRSEKHEIESSNNKQYNRNEKYDNSHNSVVGASNNIDAAKKVSKYNAFGARKDENHGRYNNSTNNNNLHHNDEVEGKGKVNSYRSNNKQQQQQRKLSSSSSSRYKLTNDFESFDDDEDDGVNDAEEEENKEESSRENISSNISRVYATHSGKILSKTKDSSSQGDERGDSIVATSSPSSVESDIMKQFEEKKLEFEELSRKVLSLPIARSDDPGGLKRDKYSISNLELQKQLISVVHELKDILKTNEAVSKNAFMKPTLSSSIRFGGGVSNASNGSNSVNAVDKKASSSSSLNQINSSNSAPLENHTVPAAPSILAARNEPKNVNSNCSSNADAVVSNSNNINNNNNNLSNINLATGFNDSKLKSLNLRLHGQMNTIKILELQIQEFNQVMQEKEKVISTLQRQVQMGSSSNGGGGCGNLRGGGVGGGGRSVSPGYRNRYPAGSGNVRNRSSAIASEEHLEKVKMQMKDIESRHNADIVRYKLLKEYAEKAKFRVNELETKVSEISEENTDLKDKNTRIKKELKDRIHECAIYQENNIEHLKTINNMKSYVSEAEEEASQLRVENNKMKTEIQNLKMEIKLSAENSKNSKMEIEILKERLDNRKTESKLFSLISGNTSVLNPNSAAAAASSSSRESSNNLGKYSMHDSNDNHSMKIVQRSKLMSFNNFISQAATSNEVSSKKKPDHHPTGFVETAMRNRRHKHELDFSQGGARTKLTATNNNSSSMRSSSSLGGGGGDSSSSSNYNRARSLSPSSRYTSSSSSSSSNLRDSFSAAASSSGNTKPAVASKAVRYSFDTFDSRSIGVAFQSEPNKISNSYNNNSRNDISNADSDDDSDFDDSKASNTGNRMTLPPRFLPPRVPLEARQSSSSSSSINKSLSDGGSSSSSSSSNRERVEVNLSDEAEVAAVEGTPPRVSNSFDTTTSSAIKSKYEKLKKMYEKVNHK